MEPNETANAETTPQAAGNPGMVGTGDQKVLPPENLPEENTRESLKGKNKDDLWAMYIEMDVKDGYTNKKKVNVEQIICALLGEEYVPEVPTAPEVTGTTPEEKPKVDPAPPKAQVKEKTQEIPDGIDSEKLMTPGAIATKKAFDAAHKVTFYVPLKNGAKQGSFETVTVNGYRMEIKKGMIVTIPKPVADILTESLNTQLGTGGISLDESMRIDRNDGKLNALV